MNWKQFDKIYVVIDPNNQNIDGVKINLKEKFYIKDFSNVEFHYTPQNKVVKEIYTTMRRNKIIVDWYNSQIDGDFYDWKDLDHTLYMLNLLNTSYMLKHNKIFIFDKNCFDNRLCRTPNIGKVLDNYPSDIDGFVLLNYKNNCVKIGENINDYYFDSEYSNNIKDINIYSLTRNCIKNILDNESMILKRLDFYLVHRNMCYDSLVKHIALNKDKL